MDKTLEQILLVLISIDIDLKTIAVTSDHSLTNNQKIELLNSIKDHTDDLIDSVN